MKATHYPNAMPRATEDRRIHSRENQWATEAATAGPQRCLLDVSAASTIYNISVDFEATGQRESYVTGVRLL